MFFFLFLPPLKHLFLIIGKTHACTFAVSLQKFQVCIAKKDLFFTKNRKFMRFDDETDVCESEKNIEK